MDKSPSQTVTYRRIKKEIENWVSYNSTVAIDWTRWYCGITNNPKIRKAQHKNKIQSDPYFFEVRNAKSLAISSSLETSFHNKGMKDTDLLGNAKETSWYIYVYKIKPTFIDVVFG